MVAELWPVDHEEDESYAEVHHGVGEDEVVEGVHGEAGVKIRVYGKKAQKNINFNQLHVTCATLINMVLTARAAQLANWTGAGGSSACRVFVGMKYLSLQLHLVMESVPTSEFEFGGHCRQVFASGAAATGENVVTGHRVQVLDCC